MKRLLKEVFMLFMCCIFPGALLLQFLWSLYRAERNHIQLGLAGAGIASFAWITAIGLILLASIIIILLAALRSNHQQLCFNRILFQKGEKLRNLVRGTVYLLSLWWIVYSYRGISEWIWCFAPVVSGVSIFTLFMNFLSAKGQE